MDPGSPVGHTGRVTDARVDLSQVGLFAGLEPTGLARLRDSSYPHRLGRGQVLFVEGEPSEQLYLVRSGRLRVFRDSARGDQVTLTFVAPGATIGELSVVDEQPRSASVDAAAPSELVAVPSGVVREVLAASPAATWAVARLLADQVRRLTDTAADLVLLDLPRRLGKLLLEQAVPDRGVLTVTFLTSQTGVAAMLGVTRQSLNRSLAALARRGWIATADGGRIEIRDPAGLRRYVDS